MCVCVCVRTINEGLFSMDSRKTQHTILCAAPQSVSGKFLHWWCGVFSYMFEQLCTHMHVCVRELECVLAHTEFDLPGLCVVTTSESIFPPTTHPLSLTLCLSLSFSNGQTSMSPWCVFQWMGNPHSTTNGDCDMRKEYAGDMSHEAQSVTAQGAGRMSNAEGGAENGFAGCQVEGVRSQRRVTFPDTLSVSSNSGHSLPRLPEELEDACGCDLEPEGDRRCASPQEEWLLSSRSNGVRVSSSSSGGGGIPQRKMRKKKGQQPLYRNVRRFLG